jgi:DNA polymerase V
LSIGEYTEDFFTITQPTEATNLMAVLDKINDRWGRGMMRPASVPISPCWAMRREMKSQSFTTLIDELWMVDCN